MSVESAKAKLDAQPGDPATGYISKADHQDSYTELVDDTALTGATTAEALTISGNLNGRDPDNLVAGPGSSTDNALVRFDGTGGKTVQGSGITVDDSGKVTFGDVGATAGLELGSSGPRIMSGTGSPEGVVTAPINSVWNRSDGDTLGDFSYRKISGTGSTGWVVEYGDTGVRELSGSLLNGWVMGDCHLRRVGHTVTLTMYDVNGSAATSNVAVGGSTLTGFQQPSTVVAAFIGVSSQAAPTVRVAAYEANVSFGTGYAGVTTGAVAMTWQTSDAWPSTLPGTAA